MYSDADRVACYLSMVRLATAVESFSRDLSRPESHERLLAWLEFINRFTSPEFEDLLYNLVADLQLEWTTQEATGHLLTQLRDLASTAAAAIAEHRFQSDPAQLRSMSFQFEVFLTSSLQYWLSIARSADRCKELLAAADLNKASIPELPFDVNLARDKLPPIAATPREGDPQTEQVFVPAVVALQLGIPRNMLPSSGPLPTTELAKKHGVDPKKLDTKLKRYRDAGGQDYWEISGKKEKYAYFETAAILNLISELKNPILDNL